MSTLGIIGVGAIGSRHRPYVAREAFGMTVIGVNEARPFR